MSSPFLNDALQQVEDFFLEPNAMRSIIILMLALLAAFYVSKLIAHYLIKAARNIASVADSSDNVEKSFKRAVRIKE